MANQYKPFGIDADPALTLTPEAYDADAQRLTGNQIGPARPELVNAALRQTSVVAAALTSALETLDSLGVDDDGDANALAERFAAAFGGGGLSFEVSGSMGASAPPGTLYTMGNGSTLIDGHYAGEVALANGSGDGAIVTYRSEADYPIWLYPSDAIPGDPDDTIDGGWPLIVNPGETVQLFVRDAAAHRWGIAYHYPPPGASAGSDFPADATGVAVTATLPPASPLYGAAVVLERGTTAEGSYAVVMATPLQSLPAAVSNLNIGLLGVEAPAWVHGLLAWNAPIRWITWTANGSGGVTVPSGTQVYLSAPVRDSAGVYTVAFGAQFVGPTLYSVSVDIEGGAGYGWEVSGKSGAGFTLTFRDLATMAAADPPSGMVTVRVWPVSAPYLPTMLP